MYGILYLVVRVPDFGVVVNCRSVGHQGRAFCFAESWLSTNAKGVFEGLFMDSLAV